MTHDQTEAMTMADRIAVVMDGEILQCASPEEVYHNPVNKRVAEFIGSPAINVLPIDVVSPELSHQGVDSIGLRPENIRISDVSEDQSAELTFVENLGSEKLLYLVLNPKHRRLDINVHSNLKIVVKVTDERKWVSMIGETLQIDFDLNKAIYFDVHGNSVGKEKITDYSKIDHHVGEVVNA